VVTVRTERYSPAEPFSVAYTLIVADPAPYAALTRAVGLPDFPASAYAGWKRGDPLPAVVSPALAAVLRDGPATITTGMGSADVRAAATLPTTAASPGTAFLVLSRAQLTAIHPEMRAYPQYSGPTALLAVRAPGRHIDGRALHAAARSVPLATVLLRDEQRTALSDSPLQQGARRIYLAAVAAGAGFSVLALLLSLLQAAPQRTALLARLRTMGMGRAQSQRLVLLEMLPQVLLAAVGGVLVGLAVIPLLGPGIDLRALAFGAGARDLAPFDIGIGLRADPWSLALPSIALVALACAVLLTQSWLTTRRRESTELRAGDRAT
jgi:putative ABC transport system permease protein